MLNFKLSFDETVFLCCFISVFYLLIYIIFGRKYLDPRPYFIFI